ncbi:MAG: circadian clock KaiB family protein [Pelolinea sp.]|nr:circadian clock KaiB family protein [Pelolinea sp.]
MSVPSQKGSRSPTRDRQTTLFWLYVAGKTPNSVQAIANLQSICQEYLRDRYKIEVVDMLQEPLRALSEGVLVTPTLVRLSPLPVRKILGDLSDRNAVLHVLGLEESPE